MKKITLLVALALVLFIPFITNVKAEDSKKVTIYFFRGEGCSHCAEAEEWFEELAKDEEYSKYYEIKDFEVWYSEDNAKLMDSVAKELGTEANGVPFIVIGDKYFSGFSKSMVDEIKSTIKEAYEGDSYKDVVKSVQKGTTTKEEKEKSILIPVLIVSVIAIGTVIGLVFFTKEK